MLDTVFTATNQIRELILTAMGRAVTDGALSPEPTPDFVIETPSDRSNGDFASNVALVSAKAFRLPPRKIAETIHANLDLEPTYFDKVIIAGPGFLNFYLKPAFYADSVLSVLQKGQAYGQTDYGKGKKIMVEFVSANPTGPMHIGNARGGALGDCLASVLSCAGYDVSREFYINDAGNQIEKFGLSLEARYLQIFKGPDAVSFPEDGYHGADITVRAGEYAEQFGDGLVDADPQKRRKTLIEYALPKNIDALRADLLTYRIEYDTWFSESTLHQNGELSETITLLTQNGQTYEKDGALWYKATEHGGEKDEVLIRANGHPTYFAADIAYHRNKFQTRRFDTVINIWGADHHGHVARLKGAMDAIGVSSSRLDIVLMQLVRLMLNGEPVKVSKRTGKSITLSNLLEEIPVDAARYFFNMREAGTQMDFDLGLAVEQSSQNPVYYVQYAHARICSIVSNLAKEGIVAGECLSENLTLLTQTEERELIRHIASLPLEILESAKAYDPARITRYALDLAMLFHKFYNACRVKGEPEPLLQARLSLCIATRQVLANVLQILKVAAPESM